jgi:serine/threonine-protein kinase HipA
VPGPVSAEVRLHGRRVGALRFDRGGSTFSYEDDLTDPAHLVLGQVFEDDPRSVRRARIGVPPWFANLLPEGALRQQIIRELGGGNIGDFTLLLRLGSYLPGAVTVHGEVEPADDVGADLVLDVPEHPLRHSLAGFQLKYTVREERLTLPASGQGGWWIVKLPDRSLRDLPVNEYLTMRWLAAAGFPVPPIHLEPADAVDGIPDGLVDPAELVYLIERFDRIPAGRVHVEDFAQVANVEPMFKYSESGATYDTLAAAILQLTGEAGYAEYIQRLVAMVVVGNTDAHLKNWALLYSDGRTPSLAPIYDFHSLTVYTRYRYAALALSLNEEKVANAIGPEDLRRLADRAGADPERTVQWGLETVNRLREAWTKDLRQEAEARFDALAQHFTHRLESLPICLAG